jgi:hypothetical protein
MTKLGSPRGAPCPIPARSVVSFSCIAELDSLRAQSAAWLAVLAAPLSASQWRTTRCALWALLSVFVGLSERLLAATLLQRRQCYRSIYDGPAGSVQRLRGQDAAAGGSGSPAAVVVVD